MRRCFGAVLAALTLAGSVGPARADGDKDVNAVLDKAIKALGGEEKLRAADTATWTSENKITVGDNEGTITSHVTVKGLDHFRQHADGQFSGSPFRSITVVNGDRGWRHLGYAKTELDGSSLTNQKRNVYLMVIPANILPLKGKGFQARLAGEEDVDGKPAQVVKVTPPVGKDFTLYFDKDSGLPLKVVAKVVGNQGDEFTLATTFADYKDFGGLKRATKLRSTRDGEPFVAQEIIEFKVLDKVDPATFAEPK